MKTLFFVILLLIAHVCIAQPVKVVVFKHEMRWTDETRFPNYFADAAVREQIFENTAQAFTQRFGFTNIEFPDAVDYNIYQGFKKQKTDMPKQAKGDEIGIFSFITRATSGSTMYWKMNVVVRQHNAVIHQKEISHELEYFNIAGYFSQLCWMQDTLFVALFDRLIREALELQPQSNECIVVGSLESMHTRVNEISPELKQSLFKIRGAWQTGGNFAGRIEDDELNDLSFNFGKWHSSNSFKPTFSQILATVFTETTGIDFLYNQKVKNQIEGNLSFTNLKQEFGIRQKWVDIATRTVKTGEVVSKISDPAVTELFDAQGQIGYMVYTYQEIINETNMSTRKFNFYTGYVDKNTLGIQRIHTVKGMLNDKPLKAEYYVSDGIVLVYLDEAVSGAMILANCNPNNRTFSNQKLSKNKTVQHSSVSTIGFPSLDEEDKNEWYPVYFREDAPEEEKIKVIQSLVCMFFSVRRVPAI
jgi:hypothetical protein